MGAAILSRPVCANPATTTPDRPMGGLAIHLYLEMSIERCISFG
jgi:hypothetical protein